MFEVGGFTHSLITGQGETATIVRRCVVDQARVANRIVLHGVRDRSASLILPWSAMVDFRRSASTFTSQLTWMLCGVISTKRPFSSFAVPAQSRDWHLHDKTKNITNESSLQLWSAYLT